MLRFQEPIPAVDQERVNARRARLARLGMGTQSVAKPAEIERKTYIVEPVAPRPKISRYYTDAAYEASWSVEICGLEMIYGPTNINTILKVVAKHYKVSIDDIVSARRTSDIVMPRHIAMYLARTMTPRSFPEVGRRMGNRDHTTVLHGFKKIERLVRENPNVADDVNAIKRSIMMAAYV